MTLEGTNDGVGLLDRPGMGRATRLGRTISCAPNASRSTMIVKESHDLNDPVRQALIPPLQKIVKERGLWATHLGPHLGGPGFGQVKLALLNEILGRSECAPIVFGSHAPDSGNSEILAHYGTPELKERYLEPLLDNRIVSCFSMTEPQGGADPKVFTTTAVQDGDEWVINGEKWFSSFASMASFLIVMAVTDPDAPPYERHSMFVVPGDTPGINVLRDVGLGYQPPRRRPRGLRPLRGRPGAGRSHARPARRRVRRGADPPRRWPHPPRHAHRRAGAAHLRHALRARGLALHPGRHARQQADGPGDDRRFLDGDRGVPAADHANRVEDRPAQRLSGGARRHLGGQGDDAEGAARRLAPARCRLHGSLGTTHEMPFVQYMVESFVLGLADGPTEVHKVTLARQLLKEYKPAPDLFPSEHLLRLREAAEAKFADKLAGIPRT